MPQSHDDILTSIINYLTLAKSVISHCGELKTWKNIQRGVEGLRHLSAWEWKEMDTKKKGWAKEIWLPGYAKQLNICSHSLPKY